MNGGEPELLGRRLCIDDDFLSIFEFGLKNWAFSMALKNPIKISVPSIHTILNPGKRGLYFLEIVGFGHTLFHADKSLQAYRLQAPPAR
jgi:hypothetical protein